MITNANNGKLTDFAAISLPEIAGNEIYNYGAMWKLYTNENLK